MSAGEDRLMRGLARLGDSGDVGDADLERRVTAFRSALRRMREGPAEAARIDAIAPDVATTGATEHGDGSPRSGRKLQRRMLVVRVPKLSRAVAGIAGLAAAGLAAGAGVIWALIAWTASAGGLAILEAVFSIVAASFALIVVATIVVIIGIHQEERRKTILGEHRPQTACALVARWVLGGHFYLMPEDRPEMHDSEDDPPWFERPVSPRNR
jgi:hypothetical protein